MTDKLHGVCIGGPVNGRKFVSNDRLLMFQENPAMPRTVDVDPSVEVPEPVESKQHLYRWYQVGAGGKLGLFIHESLDVDDAMDLLLNAYAEIHTMKDVGRPG